MRLRLRILLAAAAPMVAYAATAFCEWQANPGAWDYTTRSLTCWLALVVAIGVLTCPMLGDD